MLDPSHPNLTEPYHTRCEVEIRLSTSGHGGSSQLTAICSSQSRVFVMVLAGKLRCAIPRLASLPDGTDVGWLAGCCAK